MTNISIQLLGNTSTVFNTGADTGPGGGGGGVGSWQSFSPLVALISAFIHNFDIHIDILY